MDRTTSPTTPTTTPGVPRWPGARGRRLAAAASVALLVGGLAACGGDDDETATDDAQAGAEGTPTTAAEAGLDGADGTAADVEPYCSAVLELERVVATTDPGADPVGAAEALLEPATAVGEVAPDEVAPVLADAVGILQGVVDTGDPAGMAELEATTAPLHEYDLANCGWEVTDVAMADYSFAGIEPELTAGTHSFELTNDGAEAHVMVIIRKAEGVTQSWDEILAAGENSGLYEELTSGFAPPGGTGYALTELTAGDYMALCPIPTGTTPEAEGTGPPHFVHGMTQEFTVA